MEYYRMRLKRENGQVLVSEITEQYVEDSTFQEMMWEKPVIRHFDGEMYHFISLVPDYLEVLKDGIGIGEELFK